MDDDFLENMDSLWFFSSVLRPSPHLHLPTPNAEISTNSHEYTDAEKQDQGEQEQITAKEPSQTDPKVKEGRNCEEIAGLEKRREKRKGRKSKNRVQKWIQQSSPGMQLEERTPFAVLYDCQMGNGRSNERGGTGSQFRHLTMPPVRDDLAMKAQLRSWAYAVACSVSDISLKKRQDIYVPGCLSLFRCKIQRQNCDMCGNCAILCSTN